MAEAPNELSSQQGSDPALCSEGHPHELPAALQRIQLPEPSLEEKREVVQKWNNKAADIFILIHEGEYDVIATAEPRENSLLETEYPMTCEAVLKWLQQVLRFFPSTDTEVEKCILETLKHLRDNDFLISVFGQFNSGKSTLLNAVLANECLPESEQSETMMPVRIAHRRDTHPGSCKSCSNVQMCPLLEESKPVDGQKMILPDNPTRGAENIYEALTVIDQKVKGKKLEVTSQFTIKAHVPAIANVQEPWRVFLVDNPGFSAGDDGINSLAHTAMKTSHAYVLTLDYNTIEDERNAKTFQDIFRKDGSVFTDGEKSRLVIAVTRLDSHYLNSIKRRLSLQNLKDKAKKLVCDAVEKAVGARISDKKVIPVIGRWALSARQLKYLQDSQSLQQAEQNLTQLFPASGEGQKVSPARHRDEIVEILEEKSGIKQLEEEIQNIVKVFGSVWISSIHCECSSYIEATLKVLRDTISLLQGFMMVQDGKYKQGLCHQQNIAHTQQAFIQNLKCDGSSPAEKQLKECYARDVKDISERAKVELTAFMKRNRKKLAKGRISPESFYSDLQKPLEKVIDEHRFKSMCEELEVLREDATRQIAHLEYLTRQYCTTECEKRESTAKPLVTLDGIKYKDMIEHHPNLLEEHRTYQRDSAVVASYTKSKEEMSRSSKTPGFWEELWEILIKKPLKLLLRSGETLDEAESVECDNEVNQILCTYFDQLQPAIIRFFFNQYYRDYVVHGLEDFSKRLTEEERQAKEQQGKELKVTGAVLKEMQVDVDRLKSWCENLMNFMKILRQQAGVYSQEYFQCTCCLPDDVLPESPASADPTTKQSSQAELPHVASSEFPASAVPTANKRQNVQDVSVYSHSDAIMGRVRIYWAFERKERKQTVKCSEFESYEKDDILSTCEAAASQLLAINAEYPGLLTTFSAHLINTWTQFDQKKISIAVFGHLASGKSMLVNAILTDSVLPIGKTVKSVEVRIRNNGQVHKGHCPKYADGKTCQQCPVLLRVRGSKLVEQTRGASNIAESLHKIDEAKKTDTKPSFIIEGFAPILDTACIPPWKVYLIENAGYKELKSWKELQSQDEEFISQEELQRREKECKSWKKTNREEGNRIIREVKAAKAHIFTLPYKDRQNKAHYELLGRLLEADESVFRENRITIVITFFEEFYKDDQHPTVESVKDGIYCRIKDKVHAGDKPKFLDCLVTVCGEWANTARKFQSMPLKQLELLDELEQLEEQNQLQQRQKKQLKQLEKLKELKQRVVCYLSVYEDATGTSGRDGKLNAVSIASKLLAASGIKVVEQRVMKMAAACSEDSVMVLCSSFNRNLKEAADYLDASSTAIKGRNEEKKSEYEAYYETIDKYRKQLTARSDAKHVQKSVQCPESIEEIGMKKCQEVLTQASESDLPSLEKALNEELNDTSMFQSAWDVCYSHSTDVTKILESMRETAARVVQPRSRARTIALQATEAGQVPENDATPTVLNAEDFVKKILKNTGSFKISENKRATPGDQFKESILEDFRVYMQSVVQHTQKYMEEYWQTVVKNAIRSFDIEFNKESLDQRNEELTSETERWSIEAKHIEEYRDHLHSLRNYLVVKAEDCRVKIQKMKERNLVY